jgi:hypothetical protein
VLKEPQAPGGVAGWECCVRTVGVHTLEDWTLDYPHVNLETPPCFEVALDTPLPPAPAIVLATFDLVAVVEGGSDYYLMPITDPVLPGEFSYYGPGDYYVPLRTITHRPWAAASIFDPAFGDILHPTPPGSNGGVVLRWPAPPGDDLEYHVLRRIGEGQAQRLNVEPLRAVGGEAGIVDALDEKVKDQVYYTIVAEVAGIEVARSPELVWTQPELPATVVLHPNYPNPFNPETTLSFELPTAGPVRLGVFDLAGQRVATLVAESLNAGRHQRIWTGRDDAGRGVPSGAYYARLEAGGMVTMIRMTLLK